MLNDNNIATILTAQKSNKKDKPKGPPRYKRYSLQNFETIPQVQQYLTEEQIFNIKVTGQIFAFKVNPYVINRLINWDNIPNDPIFILTFPQKGMLKPHHFEWMAEHLRNNASEKEIAATAHKIRLELNPHPAGQMDNVPTLKDGTRLPGIQHKYNETALFFAQQGQTCHAHCTFCFRWPQFVGMEGQKFAMKEVDLLIRYLQEHPEITDLLFTGGDPMTMPAKTFGEYIDSILDADLPNLKTIRIGSKSLTYWPHKYTTDKEAPQILGVFNKIINHGLHVAFMAHFNHPVELSTDVVKKAILNIRATGVEIRAQSPVLKHINADAKIWQELWKEEVKQGIIPYYMFQVRDTGAQHFYNLTLEEAYNIFKEAAQSLSGLARTVRGPSMSCYPGKVEVLGIQEIRGEKVFVLRMLQGRNYEWCYKPFFAEYNPNATWIDDLKPAFGEKRFFFQ
jgi:KamA family protein